MDYLDQLEAEAIYILREVAGQFERPALLFSGGKDSVWQLQTALQYDLKPLCVTWKTPSRTKEGYFNLLNSINYFGCDHIDFTINPKIEKYFTLKSLF